MAKKAVSKTVSMKGVHGGLAKAIAHLKKLKDPAAATMAADLMTFKASISCGQTMVFKFKG